MSKVSLRYFRESNKGLGCRPQKIIEKQRRTAMQKTLSITIGKGSIGHNNRDFYADNIDISRSQNNIIFHKEDIKKVYQELFGTALEEYNAKQKRKDRIIKDYYDHIFHSKQEKPFYELIIQVGNKDDTHCNSDEGKLA